MSSRFFVYYRVNGKFHFLGVPPSQPNPDANLEHPAQPGTRPRVPNWRLSPSF
jgi:hypothetical protein